MEKTSAAAVKRRPAPPVKSRKPSFIGRFFRVGRGMDWGFYGIVVLLTTIGLVMLYSASYPIAYYEEGNSSGIFVKQCGFALLGFITMTAASFFKYEKLKTKFWTYLIVGVSYAGLLAVGVLAKAKHEVIRSISVGPVSIQASEITKFAVILFMAYICDRYYADDFKIIFSGIVLLGTTAVLLYLEPHYSAIVIMAMLVCVMMYLGGVRIRWFLILGVVLALVIGLLAATGKLGYAMERMEGWGQALTAEYGTDLYESTRQTRNSMYAIGSGGLTGLGFGESRQKYLFLAEPQNDFVFAIVIEELGLIGAVLILALFALLIYQGIRISLRSRDRFGMLLGVGLTLQIAIQLVLNLLVITDWMPNTGISLPFISAGGSSLVVLMTQMGLILSISRTAKIEKT